jgi:hypothetical protein
MILSFYIPVKIWLYHDDNGTKVALSELEVHNLLDGVNECKIFAKS